MSYFRQYAMWEPSEIERLRMMHDKGLSRKAMSSALSRTVDAITSKLAQVCPPEPNPQECLERQASLLRRLIDCHGEDRAVRIIEGRDPATEADVAAWNRLGRGRAAA